jgi:hypothetical protein
MSYISSYLSIQNIQIKIQMLYFISLAGSDHGGGIIVGEGGLIQLTHFSHSTLP